MGQTSVSTLSQQPERQEGSVDGLDKPAITNSDGPNSGSQSPPLKRKGKLSTIGKIFKPWKWRKKKASEKFRETSAVLERKISTRQSREELIRRGLLKEIPDQDGGVPANVETSNGHMIVVSEEAPSEGKVSNNIGAGNGSVPTMAAKGEEDKTEANSSIAKKTPAGKTSSSSPSSSRPKASKDQAATKAGTSGTPRINKKPTKQLSVPAEDSNLPASTNTAKPPVVVIVEAPTDNPTTDAEESSLEQPPLNSEAEATVPEQPLSPTEEPVPAAIAPPPSQDNQASALSNAQDNEQTSSPVFLLTPALDCGQLLQSEPETDNHKINLHQENFLTVNGEITICCSSSTDENSLKEAEDLQRQETTDESSEESNPQDSESESKENTTNDSDSDGPILYTDDDDDDDDDGSAQSSLASKIRRKDSLAIKLGNRPSKKELEDKNILQRTSEEERQEKWQQIGTKLVRRLSQRPTTEELEQRNILKQKNEEEEQEARRELKRRLTRKLSLRPSVAELQARRILRFNEYVEVTDSLDYDRRADKPWARLTPADKAAIRKELNDFKSTEMEVHEESRHFTRFHRP
ncbi:phosphatase and actin regulator 2 isoform X4 [Ambystoma mexicanum]|uniref:phosphatase and actin regulator 2 isoform X4 n=1 Tax=Ambystoma mexicanum TaxID=8296 RepID=UPI0037E830B3